MDIVFGDCVTVGDYCYSLVLVDRATHYNWTFGLKSLSSEVIISVLCLFQAAAGLLVHCFYSDCDLKLLVWPSASISLMASPKSLLLLQSANRPTDSSS